MDGLARLAPTTRAHGAMFLYALLISVSFVVGDKITDALDPLVLTAERFAVGGLTFGALLAARGGLTVPTVSSLLRYAAISATMVTYFVVMFFALRQSDSVSTGALFTTMPLLTAVAAFFIVGQRTRPLQLGLMGIGAAGAAWVVFDGSLDRALRLDLGPGEWLFLAGCLSFALYSPLVRRLHRGESPVVMTFWTLVLGFIALAVLSAPRALATDWSAVTWKVHAGIAYLGAVNTAGTFVLAKYASTKLPSAKVMAYTYLTPVNVVVLEALLGHGWPSASATGGLVVAIVATLALQQTASARAAPAR